MKIDVKKLFDFVRKSGSLGALFSVPTERGQRRFIFKYPTLADYVLEETNVSVLYENEGLYFQNFFKLKDAEAIQNYLVTRIESNKAESAFRDSMVKDVLEDYCQWRDSKTKSADDLYHFLRSCTEISAELELDTIGFSLDIAHAVPTDFTLKEIFALAFVSDPDAMSVPGTKLAIEYMAEEANQTPCEFLVEVQKLLNDEERAKFGRTSFTDILRDKQVSDLFESRFDSIVHKVMENEQ